MELKGVNGMSGAIALCGVGLCVIGGGLIMQSAPRAEASLGGTAVQGLGAITSMASAQTGPTVVWYGSYGGNYGNNVSGAVLRAWSDGTVELKMMRHFLATDACTVAAPCSSAWFVISSPTTGFRAASDSNADQQVDGADLAALLSNWGAAPRVPFPPSDCPLDLVNP